MNSQFIRRFVNQIKIIRYRKWIFTKELGKQTFQHIGHILTLLATALTIMQWIEKGISQNDINDLPFSYGTIIIFVILCAFVWALLDVWPKTITHICHKKINVVVEVCNIFEQTGLKVIHTTDTFDMDRVKAGTVVAQFANLCRNNNFDVTKEIIKNLKNDDFVESDNSLPGLKDRYKLGSVCFFGSFPDDVKNARHFSKYCLVAFSHIHPGYVDRLSLNEYIETLGIMWNNLSVANVNSDNTINITVIGDQNLRLPDDCNFTQKIGLIIETFYNASSKQGFCDTLRICVSVNDMAKIDFTKFDSVMNFLSERSELMTNG